MKTLYMTTLVLVAFLTVSSTAYAGEALKFEASLSGDQEVTGTTPPGVVTNTTGRIKVEFDEALTRADFELEVFNGVDVTQAHFHCASAGVNAPFVAFLFGFVAGGVNVDGVLSSGTLTNADIIAAVCPGSLPPGPPPPCRPSIISLPWLPRCGRVGFTSTFIP